MIGRDWRGALWRAAATAFVLEVLLVPAVLFWPRFEENMPALRAMAPLKILSEQLEHIEEKGAIAYVIAQHFFKACSTLGVLAAVLFACSAVAGEALRGTLEIWLARPLSRTRILIERWLQGAFAVAAPIFVTTATIPVLCARVGEELELAPLLWCAAHQSIFLLAIYAATFLWSTFGRNPWLIATGVLFAALVQFALYMIDTATHWSLFRLSDVMRYVAVHEARALDWSVCGPLLGFIAACLIASVAIFRRRGL